MPRFAVARVLLASAILFEALFGADPRVVLAEEPEAVAAPAKPNRRDVADRLRRLEESIHDQGPELDPYSRTEVLLLARDAMLAARVGAWGAAVDGLGAAQARVWRSPSPWCEALRAMNRVRVELPPVIVIHDDPYEPRIQPLVVPLAPPPDPLPEVSMSGVTHPRGRCGCGTVGHHEDWTWLAKSLPPDSMNDHELRDLGYRVCAVFLWGWCTPEGWLAGISVDASVTTRTNFVTLHELDRLDKACEALRTLPAVRTVGGVRPTLERLATRTRNAIEGKAGDVVPDVLDELCLLEEGVRGVREAAEDDVDEPFRPTMLELQGDTHRVTATGAAYRLLVPSEPGGVGTDPRGLVIALHDEGGSEDTFFEAYGAGEAVRQATKRGWILAAPEDPARAIEVLRDVRSLLAVDPKRIYLVGHGEGAEEAWSVAMRRPCLWAAVAPISGGWTSSAAPTTTAPPVLAIVGAFDTHRGPTARAVRRAQAGGARVGLRIEPESDHVLVVGASLPAVFSFFDAHPRP